MEYFNQLQDLAIQYGLKILIALIIIFIGIKIIKYVMNLFEKTFEDKMEPTLMKFLKSVAKVLLTVMLLLSAASTLGIAMSSFVAVLGAMAFAIALSLQESFSKFCRWSFDFIIKTIQGGRFY